MSPSPATRHHHGNRAPRQRRGQRGYTLIELAVVGLILGIISVVAIPALHTVIRRAKLEGLTREIAVALQGARQESIKMGVDVVVQFRNSTDSEAASLLAFADIPVGIDPPNRIFEPDDTKPHRSVDYQVARTFLGNPRRNKQMRFDFAAPADATDGSFWGFSDAEETGDPLADKIIIFRPDGSIEERGGFRFGDYREPHGDADAGQCGNCFEVRVAPAATAKISFLKYNYAEEEWVPSSRRDGRTLWKWY